MSAFTATVIGVAVGGLVGFAGSLIDDALMWITELFQVVPRFFLALIVVAVIGSNVWLRPAARPDLLARRRTTPAFGGADPSHT